MASKNKIRNEVEKQVEKQRSKHPVAFLLVVLFLVVGALVGYFGVQALTKNDKFELIGESTITLNLGETYEDEGAVAISFNRDISDKIVTETNLPETMTAGRYYIRYTVDDLRFNGVVRYRTIIILDEVGGSDGEEI